MLLLNKIFVPFLAIVRYGLSICFFEEEGRLFFSSAGNDRKDNEDDNEEEDGKEEDGDDLDNFDRERLLEDFLGDLKDAEVTPGESRSNLPEIYNLTPDDYPEVEIPEESRERINELRNIAESIEKRKHKLEYVSKDLVKGDYRIDYAGQLNAAQLTAVTTTEGPLLVIAGAGSGKTRVIVYRVSYLLENHVDPGKILLLTFTRKAAHEMLNRVGQLLKDTRAGKVVGGTFHSFAVHVLRKYAGLLNLPNNFTIIDTGDSEDTIDLIRTELKFNRKDKKFPRKKRLQKIISGSRNRNMTISDFVEKFYTGLIDYVKDIELIYNGYTRYKEMSNIFDFDDLMEFLRNSLRDKPRFRKRLQEDFGYIMVDEFQDTNVVQKEIVDLLGMKHQNIMVVGDDSQSIYAFRGANYENILRFPQQFPHCKVVKIEKNYRSSKKILEFTNNIIDHSVIGYRKKLYSDIESYNLPTIKRFYDEEEEAAFVVSKILELREQNVPLNEMAVLNRADWHNRYIQTELNKRGIPYVVVGGFKFNERMHIKDMIAYLRIVLNPHDSVAWHRVLKLLPGIGKVTAGKIVREVRKGGEIELDKFMGKKFFIQLRQLRDVLNRAGDDNLYVNERLQILKDYYAPILESKEPDYQSRLLDIDVLIDLAKKYDTIDRFLSDFALEPPSRSLSGETAPLIDESEESPMTISTVHSAKGLEWNTVIIPHALDGLFPSIRAKDLEEMEEERRLFYVACSRAKERLFITFPGVLYSYNAVFTYPSRFLAEIEKDRFTF
ncbi:MAG: ATP-dependent helicase [Bacteroidales bacterium]|nr:ATP-dependent helicase [Bacteroidales bacterium]